jgi:tRNA threonylcarbamoyladenosine biosynthesis protein TsaB
MRVLALDTTTREGSVALVEDDRVIAVHAGDPARSHAERLPGDVTRALAQAEWDVSRVDVFAVVAGPGSFTGLRIGIATVQGLAFVHHRQVVGVSALEALAQAASIGRNAGTVIGVWMDAHRHEVFNALYAVADAPAYSPERLQVVAGASAGRPADVLAGWARLARVEIFAGDGAVAYSSLLEPARVDAKVPLLAEAAGLMAVERARRGEAVQPAELHPFYVRRPDVEVARDQGRTAARRE